MAQNITLMGASYPDVPAVTLPKTGGGTATFTDVSDTTATASDVISGKYFYDASGVRTQGTGTGGGGGATQHTIHLEFSDSTDTDIDVYYDDALIGTMITAYAPSGDWTYSSKIVDTAALDNVTWYNRPTETWETVFESAAIHINPGNPYGSMWISDLGDVSIAVGSVWRITVDGDPYVVTATGNGVYGSPHNGIIGNPLYMNGTDDGSDVPICFEQNPWGAWSGGAAAALSDDRDHAIKIERQVTA